MLLSEDSPRAPTRALQRRVLRCAIWAALAVMLLSRISKNVVDLDIYHQMALIRDSIILGHIPTTDHFAYGPVLPYVVHHEWGAGVIAYFVSAWFGGPGLLLLKYCMAAVLSWLCILVARSRSPDILPVFSLLAPVGMLFAGAAFSPVRAHLYSHILVACLLWFLERDRRGDRRWVALWLPLSLFWVNVHAGFVVGIGLIGLYCLEQFLRGKRWQHLPFVAAGMAALAAVNPYGLHYYSYLWRGLGMPRHAIAEWMPVWEPFSFQSAVFFLSLGLLLYPIRKIGFRRMPGVAIICATAVEAALHQKMLPFYAIAWTCYMPGYILATPLGARLKAFFDRPPLVFQAAWILVAIFFLNLTVTYGLCNLAVPGDGQAGEIAYPAGAVDYLANHRFKGNIMTPFEYGAYVSWKLYPAALVSLDSRYEAVFPAWWPDEVFRFYRADPGWKQTLAAWPTDVVLVRRTQPLAQSMQETEWKRIYIDRAYEIYARPGLDLPAVDYHDKVFAGRFP